MSRRQENSSFICANCGRVVAPLNNGSYRNHCPFCLYSRHVDNLPGDRASTCGGLMQPQGIQYKSNKGYQLIHRCLRCGKIVCNKTAADTIQPDDFDLILQLMSQQVDAIRI